MGRYVLFRLAGLVLVLVVLSLITFVLMHEVPGGPWKVGQRPFTEEQIAALKKRYGLDKPLWQQYLTWAAGALRLDFGRSFEHPDETVTQLVARTWPTTAHLGLMSLMVVFGVGLPLGALGALKQKTWLDYATTLFSVSLFVIPSYVWAIVFILTFAAALRWLPASGWEGPRYWVMPVIVYSLAPMAVVARFTRASLGEALHADYVRTARAKGLRERAILWRHVLKNALIPMITALGPIVPELITGSIFIEYIFRVPGLGKFWVTSTKMHDYPVIIGLTLLYGVLISVTYLISDVLYHIADPRIRHR